MRLGELTVDRGLRKVRNGDRTVVFIIAVTIVVGIRMVRPLRALTTATHHPDGHHARVRVTGRDEIGALAAALNHMSKRREQAEEQRRAIVSEIAHELLTRRYLRFGLSRRDVEELLFERGIEVDHVRVFRWLQRFTPLFADAARFARHAPGDRWFVAPIYPAVLEALIPSAWHHVERHANNPIEADHSQLKHRLRPMRGLPTDRTAQTIIAGHAFLQNLRRGHYELGVDAPAVKQVASAFTELARAI